ncbi:MAG: prepilin-type N-terminal cleavage/methylation domain-containing protein [Syntrophaceae bacterium]|nr:prepilin-type N-terminal cleavage/methylation domain-containing protein [Syntrophaceae bacterium]
MKKNGFTLVEMLIVIVLGALIMTVIYGAMILAQRTSAGIGRKVITQQDARAVLDFMASEIRMASYNPSMSASTWGTIPTATCGTMGNVAPVSSRRGIQVAAANSILIAMDLNGDQFIGTCTCANPVDCADPTQACASAGGASEYLLYSYNPANNVITRNVSCGGNVAFLGGTAPGTRVYNAEAGVPLFEYFDRDGNSISAPVSDANIPNIRRIKITIAAETEQTDPSTGRRKRMIYTTDILVRNHALNIAF